MNKIDYLTNYIILCLVTSFVGALNICSRSKCKNGSICIPLGNDDYTCQCNNGYKGVHCEETSSFCQLNPCKNGATCVDLGSDYRCQCLNGWYGRHCQMNVDDCALRPCQNGGTCRDLENHKYICECPPNFIGMHCEHPDPCAEANPCGINGKCISDSTGNYKCHCNKGFIGPACSIDIDECVQYDTELCENGGVCVNTIGSYRCECAKGYSGERCANDIIDCKVGTCLNGGTCLDKIGHYRCVCTEYYRGKNCEIQIPICETMPCKNNGQCRDNDNDFYCTCPKQFTGKNCEIYLNPCLENICRNGGICQVDGVDKFKCLCKAGFNGKLCERNIDDCQGIRCQNRGVCEDNIDSWRCKCVAGYTGRYCELNFDECHSRLCHNNGVCIDLLNDYKCLCKSGWTGRDCNVNIDECASQPCVNGGKCEDLIGDFKCHCIEGFTGRRCESKSDICSQLFPCLNGALCRNDRHSPNGYICTCPSGFYGVNCTIQAKKCTNLDCANDGKCSVSEHGEHCLCAPGFYGDRCEYETDECRTNRCLNGGSCQDLINGYLCHCPLGYKGKSCEINIDECAANPCGSNGLCMDDVNGYRCQCFLPYYGENCSAIYSPCKDNLCENDATCIPTSDYQSYHCNCATALGEFKGRYCELDINECTLNNTELLSLHLLEPYPIRSLSGPCFNDGTCINTNGTFICKCAIGYEGKQCEINKDDCAENPCRNGGSCKDLVNSHVCHCRAGFVGANCEIEINECDPLPCRSGSQCYDHVSNYQCGCLPGYSGRNCEFNDNDCTKQSCSSHGTCVDKINDFECHCFSGYTGKYCQHQQRPCDSNKCLNNGTCVNRYTNALEAEYFCACRKGFSGPLCDIKMDWCHRSPCGIHGMCIPDRDHFKCNCSEGYLGEKCEIMRNETCESYSLKNQSKTSELCLHDGFCFNLPDGGGFKCSCPSGYKGTFCEENIDECANQPCLNDGECIDGIGMYSCKCAPGFQGVNCEVNVDDCESAPCRYGSCLDQIDNFTCVCPRGTSGRTCNHIEDYCKDVKCHNGGKCSSIIGDFHCNCKRGFAGRFCDIDVDECRYIANGTLPVAINKPFGLCSPLGTVECLDGPGNFTCMCKPSFTGRFCQIRVDACHQMRKIGQTPCTNGGICINHYNRTNGDNRHSYRCLCLEGYGGDRCQLYNERCASNPCRNGGLCRPLDKGHKMSFHCDCVSGVGGLFCERDYVNECDTTTCYNGGHCLDDSGKGTCQCAEGFAGEKCEMNAAKVYTNSSGLLVATYDEELRQCNLHNCRSKSDNRKCDEECNNFACRFDGDECLHKVPKSLDRKTIKLAEPWSNCTIIRTHNVPCQHLFSNGQCDPLCNNEQCLFDGWDCEKLVKQCSNKPYCDPLYGDRKCHMECNSLECDFDGGDCSEASNMTIPGSIVLVLPVSTSVFVRVWQSRLLQSLAHLLHTIVRIKRKKSGESMIYPIKIFVDNTPYRRLGRRKRAIIKDDPHGKPGTKVYLEMDNRLCNSMDIACFHNSKAAAEFVTAALHMRSYRPPIPILSVQSDNSDIPPVLPPRRSLSTSVTYAIIVLSCILVVGILVGVLFRYSNLKSKSINLKTKRAETWFPDGMKRHNHPASYYYHKSLIAANKKRKPHLQSDVTYNSELENLGQMSKSKTSTNDSIDDGGSNSATSTRATSYEVNGNDMSIHSSENCMLLSNVDDCSSSPSDKLRQSERTSTSYVEEPSNFEKCCFNTLVHLLISDPGLGTLESSDSQDKEVVMAKLVQIAKGDQTNHDECSGLSNFDSKEDVAFKSLAKIISLTVEDTGETLIHLAARSNHKEAVRFLLESGSDPNKEDHQGRCCLLSAIDASALEVVLYLIEQRHNPINIHHKCSNGTTALIQAVKGAHLDVVNVLLQHTLLDECDLNLPDGYGRTALHWACITNQLPVAQMLLAYGLNRDAQDHEEMTPFFLACKEGCLDLCKFLVTSGSNIDMRDHVDHSPLDIAKENNNHDIVTFLEEYSNMPKENQHSMAMSWHQYNNYSDYCCPPNRTVDLKSSIYASLPFHGHCHPRHKHNQSELYNRSLAYQGHLSTTSSRCQTQGNGQEHQVIYNNLNNCSNDFARQLIPTMKTCQSHYNGPQRPGHAYPMTGHYTSSVSAVGITPSPDTDSSEYWSTSSASLSPRPKNQLLFPRHNCQQQLQGRQSSVLHYYPTSEPMGHENQRPMDQKWDSYQI